MSSRRSRRKRRAQAGGGAASPGFNARWSGRARGLGAFVRDYTAGLSGSEIKRLFNRDAASAYSVLTREHAELPEPKGRGKRLLFRTRLAFLGLSYKLTPARRALFALSLICIVVALMTGDYTYQTVQRTHALHVSVDFSPFWFLLSAGGLIFLLALELVDRVRVRDELQVARELQAELLPHGAIELAGYRFAHSYRTANEVGGDYYDVMPLPDGRVALMVGDATGHGMASGLVMAIANATLKTALDIDPDPRRVIALLNRTLCRTGTRRTFMTVFYALLDPATGELASICAGHPFPVLRRASGEVVELGRGGLPLGVREDLAPEPQTTVLGPGDMLLLYTDGLAEAIDRGSEAFGYARVADLTRAGGTPQQLHDRILAAFDAHVGDEALRDDLTLLVLARDGSGMAGRSGAGAPASSGGGAGAGGPGTVVTATGTTGAGDPGTRGPDPGEGGRGAGEGGPADRRAETAAKVAAMARAINRAAAAPPPPAGKPDDPEPGG